MRVFLLKSWTNSIGTKYPVGRILHVTNRLANELLRDNIGIEYTGQYPPKKKTKINFFKP